MDAPVIPPRTTKERPASVPSLGASLERRHVYLPPWRDVQPDGSLSEPYGPAPSTLARRETAHRNWSWRPGGRPNRLAELEAFVFPDGEYVREGIPDREAQAYWLLVHERMTRREAAEALGVEVPTLRTYVRRLKRRAKAESGRPGCK